MASNRKSLWSIGHTHDSEQNLSEHELEQKLEISQKLLQIKDRECSELRTQVGRQQDFMMEVILELIRNKPQAAATVVAKPTLSSYLDKKDNKPLNGPEPGKLPA